MKDWAYSFIPLILGFIFQFAWIFKIKLDTQFFIAIVAFLTTTIGFTSVGYLTNEYFDRESDLLSGKKNYLADLSITKVSFLFILAIITTLAPWLILRLSYISIVLVSVELSLFLIYSLPQTRFKNVTYLSNIIDTLYAYLIPVALTYRTFFFYAPINVEFDILYLYLILFFFVGFRNILIHHIVDATHDNIGQIKTLALKWGVEKAKSRIKIILILEFIAGLVLLKFIISSYYILIFLIAIYAWAFFKTYQDKKEKPYQNKFVIDQFYQIYLPVVILFLLASQQSAWYPILFIFYFLFARELNSKIYYYLKSVKNKLSIIVNYGIYYIFLIFGVDLKKENSSAWQYIKKKLKL